MATTSRHVSSDNLSLYVSMALAKYNKKKHPTESNQTCNAKTEESEKDPPEKAGESEKDPPEKVEESEKDPPEKAEESEKDPPEKAEESEKGPPVITSLTLEEKNSEIPEQASDNISLPVHVKDKRKSQQPVKKMIDIINEVFTSEIIKRLFQDLFDQEYEKNMSVEIKALVYTAKAIGVYSFHLSLSGLKEAIMQKLWDTIIINSLPIGKDDRYNMGRVFHDSLITTIIMAFYFRTTGKTLIAEDIREFYCNIRKNKTYDPSEKYMIYSVVWGMVYYSRITYAFFQYYCTHPYFNGIFVTCDHVDDIKLKIKKPRQCIAFILPPSIYELVILKKLNKWDINQAIEYDSTTGYNSTVGYNSNAFKDLHENGCIRFDFNLFAPA